MGYSRGDSGTELRGCRGHFRAKASFLFLSFQKFVFRGKGKETER